MQWIKLCMIYVMLLFMFYYYLFTPLSNKIIEATINKNNLQHNISEKQRASRNNLIVKQRAIHLVSITALDLIKHFYNNNIPNGHAIKNIYVEHFHKRGKLLYVSLRIEFFGDMYQLQKWLARLNHDYFLIDIAEITMKSSLQQASIRLTLFNLINETNMSYIFQWIGYKHLNNHINALIRFSNEELREITVGSIINRKIKIEKISTENMVVTADNKQYVIKYGNTFKI